MFEGRNDGWLGRGRKDGGLCERVGMLGCGNGVGMLDWCRWVEMFVCNPLFAHSVPNLKLDHIHYVINLQICLIGQFAIQFKGNFTPNDKFQVVSNTSNRRFMTL